MVKAGKICFARQTMKGSNCFLLSLLHWKGKAGRVHSLWDSELHLKEPIPQAATGEK